MRAKEFIIEATVQAGYLPKIKQVILGMKPKLWENDLSLSAILVELNAALSSFSISFAEVSDTSQDSAYSSVGLNGAEYNPSTDMVTVGITWYLEQVLNGETQAYYEDFANLLTASIAHELKHQDQIDKSSNNASNIKEPDDMRDYLSDHREIESYAAQAAIELEGSLSKNEILRMLGTERGRENLALYSEGVKWYLHTFDSSPVLNRFFTKLYSLVAAS